MMKMTDYTIMTYITNNCITLLLLASLTVLLNANRKMKIDGLRYVWGIMGIVLLLPFAKHLKICAIFICGTTGCCISKRQWSIGCIR